MDKTGAVLSVWACAYVVSMSECWHDQSDLLVANDITMEMTRFSVATDWILQIAVLIQVFGILREG